MLESRRRMRLNRSPRVWLRFYEIDTVNCLETIRIYFKFSLIFYKITPYSQIFSFTSQIAEFFMIVL